MSSAPLNGAATDGAATDGAATDGAATDGAATDGAATDGAAADGVGTDGSGNRGHVGPYRLAGRLGVGGMGEVYRAFDQRLDRWVALKRLRLDRRVEDRHRQRFREEAKAAAALSHPGIVQVHDVLEDDEGETWIVMELVDGRALSEVPVPLDVDRCLQLGAQVADALAAAHAQGIVHRDLKTENVLVTASGRIKITDFGLAKRLEGSVPSSADGLSVTGQVLGTVRAMSPEQSRGLEVDARSDLFALGVLLYELLTGESPFKSPDPLTTLERIRSHTQHPVHVLRPSVPAAVSAYVDALLEKNPNRRPSRAAGVSEDLRDLESTAVESNATSYESTLDPIPMGGRAAEATRTEAVDSEAVPGVDGTERSQGSFSLFRLGESRGSWWTLGALVAVLFVGRVGWNVWDLPNRGVLSPAEPGRSADSGAETAQAIYVAVGEPRILGTVTEEQSEQIELKQAAVHTAVLKALLSLDGAVPVTAERLDSSFESDLALGRALAADEVISSRLECRRRACALTLHRIQTGDGRVLALEDMQLLESGLLKISTAVRARVQRLYQGFELLPGVAEPILDPQVYDRLLELRQAFKGGGRPRAEIAEDLARLAQRAPSYPEVHLLTADVAHALYFYSREPKDLDRAFEALTTARRLAPLDPEALYRQISLLLDTGRLSEARDALDELEALQTGDVRVAMRRALLWEKEGRADEALQLLRRQLEIFPAWQGLLDLAGMEYRQGQARAARATLERLLERAPNSGRARSFLAQLELMRGDPKRAEALYRQMSEQSSSLAVTANLGLSLMLQGRFDAAVEAFRQTVETAPENPALVLNLADAELLRERDGQAHSLYDEVIRLTDGAAASADASRWQQLTVRAQAFAHSGRAQQAAEAIYLALQEAPSHPQVAYEASLVLALIGEPASALAHAKRARRDFGPAWFRLSWFETLHADPGFQELMNDD